MNPPFHEKTVKNFAAYIFLYETSAVFTLSFFLLF